MPDRIVDIVVSAIIDQSGGQLGMADIEADSDLRRDCNLDSLDTIDLVSTLEHKLGFISGEGEPRPESLQTVRSLAAFIQQKMAGDVDSHLRHTAPKPSEHGEPAAVPVEQPTRVATSKCPH